MDILFPNLGIGIENLQKTFSVFGFEIAYYGLIIGIGMIAGTCLMMWDAKKSGQDPDMYLDFAMWAIIFAVIGARIYYVVFAWEMYKDDLWEVFNIRNGGLAIYGGVIAGVLTLYFFAKKRKQPMMKIADSAVLGLLLGQIIGRWGNFVNCEAFGGYTENFLAMRLNVDNVNYTMITDELRAHQIVENGITYIQVHPTFLYESLWNLMVLTVLLIYRKHKKFNGEVFFMYLLGYGAGRFWIEGLRTDQLIFFGTGIAVSQALALILVVVSAAVIIVKRKQVKAEPENKDAAEETADAADAEEATAEEATAEEAAVTDPNAPIDITGVVLETERLILRPWKETDLDDFYAYASVDGVGQMAGWMPHESKEKTKQILDLFIEHKKVFALELKENGKVIGSLGIEPIDHYEGSVSAERPEGKGRALGYVLSKDYWGRGLMAEAVKRAITYCFEEAGCGYLYVRHDQENHQSRRVIEKCGFTYVCDQEMKNTMGETKQGCLHVIRK